jgi:hypothetical protein
MICLQENVSNNPAHIYITLLSYTNVIERACKMEYLEGTMWITIGDPVVKAHLEQQNRYSTQGNNLRHLIQLYEHTEKENIYVKCVDKETIYLIDTSIYHCYIEKSSIHCLDKETKYA